MSQLRVISLGGGVQSSTLLLMSALGEVERADFALFADTQDESAETYEWLKFLSVYCGERGLPIHTVTAGRLSDHIFEGGLKRKDGEGYFITIPAFGDRGGMGARQCTERHKLRPIRLFLREKLGKGVKERIAAAAVEMRMGISLDEVWRMKESRVRWIKNTYPLIDRRMIRHDCLLWLQRHGFPLPPKSACIYCPFHNAAYWRDMKLRRKEEWDFAVSVDGRLNERGEFLHRSLIPLGEVDLSTAEDKGQLSMFNQECEGYCGV